MFGLRMWKCIKQLTVVHRRILTVKASAKVRDNYIVIEAMSTAKESNEVKYPIVWLRDNCQCSQCFDKGSLSRVVDWRKFDCNVTPMIVEVCCYI